MKKVKLNAVRVIRGGYWSFNAHIPRAVRRGTGSPFNLVNYIVPRLVRGKR